MTPWGTHQFRARNIALANLISLAYGIDSRYVTGIPRPLAEAGYDVAATPFGEGGYTYEQIHEPLQKLLAERIHLSVHAKATQVSGYRLTVGRKGPRLSPAKAEGEIYRYLLRGTFRRTRPVWAPLRG